MRLDRDDLMRIMACHVTATYEHDSFETGRYREVFGADQESLYAAADAIIAAYGFEDDE